MKIKENDLFLSVFRTSVEGILVADRQGVILMANTACEQIFGYDIGELKDKNFAILIPDKLNKKHQALLDYKAKTSEKSAINGELDILGIKKDGTKIYLDVRFSPTKVNGNLETIAYIKDITAQRKEEYFKDHIRKILEEITQNQPLVQIGKSITETIETYFENSMASILLLNKKDNTLHELVAPNLPEVFSDLIDGITVGAYVCPCGAVAHTKKKDIVVDIEKDNLWKDYRDVARNYGLKSCWSYPIISTSKEVFGTFNVYGKHSRKPLKNEEEIILDLTYLASVAIEKHNTSIALQENERQLEIYTQKLEEKVQERTQEVMATVQKLVESNLKLEDQIGITKKAEAEALAERALSSAIAKNFPKGIITVVNNKYEIVLAEGEALEELGYKEQIVKGMTIDNIETFSENRKARLKNYVSSTLAGNHLYFEENYKNNYFSVNTAPLYDENKNTTSALIVYSDISEQKKVEMDMQLALKKEQDLNELKSRFISMASHEFRTPLSVILSSTTLIDRYNELGRHAKNKKYIKKILNNVNNLEIILNDFLCLGKLDEGKIIPTLEYLDIIQFSRSLVEEIELHTKKGQTITITNSDTTLPVRLDPKLLRHILTNLLSNATKYSPENTDISIVLVNKSETVSITLTDHGIGIPEEEQENLFQRFFRAENAANIEGTGIGLNIVKRYVELMQGTVTFKSKLNQGSTFTVELPKNNMNR